MEGDTLVLPGAIATREIDQINSNSAVNKVTLDSNMNIAKIKRSHPRKPASAAAQYAKDNTSVRSKKV